MVDALKIIAGTPIPTILVVAGVVFLLLSFADKVYGQISVSEKRKIYAFVTGLLLVSGGLGVNFLANETTIVAKAEAGTTETFEPARFDPLARPGFNCGKYKQYPKTHADRAPQTDLICVFVDLAKADRQMSDYYRAFMEIASATAKPEAKENQRMWLSVRRTACPANWDELKNPGLARQKADCLIRETNKRLEYFKKSINDREIELASG